MILINQRNKKSHSQTFVTSSSRTFPLILSAKAAVNDIVFDRLCASCVIICNAGLKSIFQ